MDHDNFMGLVFGGIFFAFLTTAVTLVLTLYFGILGLVVWPLAMAWYTWMAMEQVLQDEKEK